MGTGLHHTLEKCGMVAVKGGSVHYRLYEPHDLDKSKRTPLVMVHGGPGGSHATMYDQLFELANETPVLFYDQLGSYYSPADVTDDVLNLDRFCDELFCLIEALGFSKVVLLGHSWGGAIVAQFALLHPSRVESLILSAPLLSTEVWIEDATKLLEQLPADVNKTIKEEEEKGTTDSVAYKKAEGVFMATYCCRTQPTPQVLIKNRAKWNHVIYQKMWGPSEFSCTGFLRDLDLFPRLSEISVPTTLICGEHDIARPDTMRHVQDLIAGSVLDMIPQSGHLIYVDQAAAFLKSIAQHLARAQALSSICPNPLACV